MLVSAGLSHTTVSKNGDNSCPGCCGSTKKETKTGKGQATLQGIAVMKFGLVLFLLLSAPHWMVFLDAMKNAWVIPADGIAFQIQPGIALGFFDDLFYSQTINREMLFNPGTNFLVLLGCLWAAVDLRRLLRDRTFLAILLGAIFIAAIVFGIVPPGLIARLPFIGGIKHVDDTFSCVLIIQLLVLAAFGLRSLWDGATRESARGDAMMAAILFALLAAMFLGYTQASHREGSATHVYSVLKPGETMKLSGFFRAYALALGAALLAMPWFVRGLRLRPSACHAVVGGLCLFLFHFRHGMWTATKFDHYAMNPQTRSDLAAISPAAAAIRAESERTGEPVRVGGLGAALAAGFNTVYGIEHWIGADALINRWQRDLEEKSGMPLVWGWRFVQTRGSFPRSQVFGDLWNVRWYLGMPAELPRTVRGLDLVKTLDLVIYVSHSAWPRAFFTDQLAQCSSLDNFVTLLGAADGRPFAAIVPEKTSDAPPALPESLVGRTVLAASEYRLTENSTAFTINAPTPGVAVLGNSFEPGNWRVTLDGRPVDCFRVNHAFLGVKLPEAGVHKLRFAYWPRLLTPALWLSAAGVIGVLLTLLLGTSKKRAASLA